MKKRFIGFIALCALLLLHACNSDKSQQQQPRLAVAYERADECHLCGMVITRFPGPKAQLFEREVSGVRKFCSTRDMFSYLLQPENTHRITDIYVHDMAKAPWAEPDDSFMINARDAWYVVNHKQSGAMGPTLASFGKQGDAEQFVTANGGSVVRFDQITLQLLTGMTLGELEKGGAQAHIDSMGHHH